MNHATQAALFRSLPSTGLVSVPKLPPLQPIVARVTMDEHAYLPSTWRQAIGKRLTNRRIAEYQREGKYGTELKLPPLEHGRPCVGCKTKVNTRYFDYDYLPTAGVYCKNCRLRHRDARDKEREQRARLREVRAEDWL